MYRLRVIGATVFKQSTNQAITLPESDRHAVAKGEEYPLHSFVSVSGNHLRFALGKDSSGNQLQFKGKNTWFVYSPHVQVIKSGQVASVNPTLVSYAPSYLWMRATGRKDRWNGDLYALSWMLNGQEVGTVTVVSGAPGLKPVPRSQDASGSMRPCPEGEFKLGKVERGWWGSNIGAIWIDVHGTSPRQAIGIHEDANRYQGFPGSAGCICPLNAQDTEIVASWVAQGADRVVVDHGFGTLAKPAPMTTGNPTKLSSKGIALIKEFEGIRLNAYQDSVGVWTIGYGHTRTTQPGMQITQAQADNLFNQDVIRFEKGVADAVKVRLNQNQFDALTSFAFNLGNGALENSTLLSLLNQSRYGEAADQFLRWVNAGGNPSEGLRRRREAERRLFLQAM